MVTTTKYAIVYEVDGQNTILYRQSRDKFSTNIYRAKLYNTLASVNAAFSINKKYIQNKPQYSKMTAKILQVKYDQIKRRVIKDE